MILNQLKKPFAILCILLATSGYVSALPVSIENSDNSVALVITDVPHHLEMKQALLGQDDVDIKEVREEDAPIRNSQLQRMTRSR